MSSVTRKTEDGAWYASFHDAEGNRVQKSTGLKEKEPAELQAKKWEEEAKLGDAGLNQDLRKTVEEAARLANSGRLNADRASQLVTDIMIISNPDYGKRFHEYIDTWMERKEKKLKPSSLVIYKVNSDRVKRHIENIPLMDLTSDHFYTMRDAVGEKNSNSTANQTVQHASSILRHALKDGLIQSNPADIERLNQDDSVERGSFSREEVSKLLASGDSEMVKFLQVAVYTGLRLTDASRLSSDNLEGDWLAVKTEKTDAKVRIPISEKLSWARNRQGYFFPNLSRLSESALSQRFSRLMRKAGVPSIVKRDGVEQKRSFHSLRHTFATELAEAGVSEDVRMSLAGHLDSKTHKGYVHTKGVLRDAISKLPNY